MLHPKRRKTSKNRRANQHTESRKKNTARKKHRKGRAARKIAKRSERESKQATRAQRRAGEFTVGTHNVRTLAYKGANGVGHSNIVLKTCEPWAVM